MLKALVIPFKLLWTLFKPGTLICAPWHTVNELWRCFRVRSSQFLPKDHWRAKSEWRIHCERYNHNGESFGPERLYQSIEDYDGSQKIPTLSVFPLKYHVAEAQFCADTIERAKRFVTMVRPRYSQYRGVAYVRDTDSMGKPRTTNIPIDGRVMIDRAAFRRIKPNYAHGYLCGATRRKAAIKLVLGTKLLRTPAAPP